MKKNLHDIDKLFKAALDNQEETPSAGVWDAIDQQLDKNKVVDINRKYIQLKRVALALLVLLLGVGAYTLITINKVERLANENKIKNITKQVSDSIRQIKSENARNEINIPANNHAAEIQEPEIDGSLATEKTAGKNKLNAAGENTGNQVAINSSNSTPAKTKEKANLNNGRKINSKKGNQKTVITHSDFVEETGILITLPNKEVNVATTSLSPLTGINPETIKANPDNTFKDIIRSNGPSLNIGLTTQALPVNEIKTPRLSPFTATLFYAPGISDNHIKVEEHERRPGGPVNDRDKEKIRDGEQHQSSSTIGLQIDYKMNKHWSLQSGISLLNKSIQIEPKTIYAHADNNGDVKYLYDCSSGYLFLTSKSVTNPVIGDSIHAFASNNTLQYATIPLGISYSYSINKIELSSSFGTTVNILTKGKIETELSNGTGKEVSINNKINGLKPRYFGANIGIGIAYNFSERVAVTFMPYYNFALTSSTKNAAVKSYPNTMNLAAGLRYRL